MKLQNPHPSRTEECGTRKRQAFTSVVWKGWPPARHHRRPRRPAPGHLRAAKSLLRNEKRRHLPQVAIATKGTKAATSKTGPFKQRRDPAPRGFQSCFRSILVPRGRVGHPPISAASSREKGKCGGNQSRPAIATKTLLRKPNPRHPAKNWIHRCIVSGISTAAKDSSTQPSHADGTKWPSDHTASSP